MLKSNYDSRELLLMKRDYSRPDDLNDHSAMDWQTMARPRNDNESGMGKIWVPEKMHCPLQQRVESLSESNRQTSWPGRFIGILRPKIIRELNKGH
jgi:hypothetical protein